MPRVPVRTDTGMKRLSSFGFVPQSGQGSVEKRAKPGEKFRVCKMPGERFLPFETEGQTFFRATCAVTSHIDQSGNPPIANLATRLLTSYIT